MDIIDKLLKAVEIMEGDNKKIVEDLLIKKFQEEVNIVVKPVELTQEEKDEAEIMNYMGEIHGEE